MNFKTKQKKNLIKVSAFNIILCIVLSPLILTFILLLPVLLLYIMTKIDLYMCNNDCVEKYNNGFYIKKYNDSYDNNTYYIFNNIDNKYPKIRVYRYSNYNNYVYILGRDWSFNDKNLHVYIIDMEKYAYKKYDNFDELNISDKEFLCSFKPYEYQYFLGNYLETIYNENNIKELIKCD